jgi:exodeoxyribonuclease VII large subunit
MNDQDILSVSQLTQRIKETLEECFPEVWVAGEIVGFKRHSSGHLYFTLKDSGARLNGMVFRSQVRFLAVRTEELRDGAQVRCRGRLNLYEPHGAYKIIVDQMQFEGRGALLEELEALKRRLAQEGLFAEERKRPLPLLPSTIGIVTASTGAAIQDMLRVINQRCPSHVRLYPAAVQGEAAAFDVVRGIRILDADPEVEVIIIGRGGGAFEDLLPFSDERVVRAVAQCQTPIISAVGHEIDFPLSDFAADVRAPTPTAAAQLVVPDREAIAIRLAEAQEQMARGLGRRMDDGEQLLADRLGRLDHLAEGFLTRADSHLAHLAAQLAGAHPASRLERHVERTIALESALNLAMESCLTHFSHRLERAGELLEELGPASQFRRGYALVLKASDQTPVTDSTSVVRDDELDILVARGTIQARVTGRAD